MFKFLIKFITATFLFFAANTVIPGNVWAQTNPCYLKTASFETGFNYCVRTYYNDNNCNDPEGDDEWLTDDDSDYTAGSRSAERSRDGSYSLKIDHSFVSGKDDWRSEYHWMSLPQELHYGDEIWFTFSIYFPSDWQPQEYDYLIFQYMQDCDIPQGDPMSGPPLSCSALPNGKIRCTIKGDSRDIHTNPPQTALFLEDLATIVPGAWHDFIVHVDSISYNPDAVVEIWLRIDTGSWTKIVDRTNIRTAYNNSTNWARYIYLKFGEYTWAWNYDYYPPPARPNPDRIIMYYDNIKLGGSSCTLEDMISPLVLSKKGDLNADNKIDVIDLGIFLSNWGNPPAGGTKPPSDLNQDAKVDIIDLGILLGNWG